MPDPPWSEHPRLPGRRRQGAAAPTGSDGAVPREARSFPHAAALSGFLLLAALLGAGPAAAQGSVRKTFDDWQLRCETPAGAKAEQCALVQYLLAAEDRPNLSLVVIVLKTADNRGYLLRVVAPLGVLLPLASASRSTRRISGAPASYDASPPAASPRL